ncbi:MAG: hypothetical protein ABEJ61_06530 [Haloferacaceae archaeon]
MRLAEDERARVPFALVGVLLVLASTAFATTLSTRGMVHEDRATDRAMEHVRASATAALRDAVREAARDAAREPVTAPADTPFGRVLDDDRPFRDALRVRIYVVAREHLRATRYRRDGVTARASLQSTPTPDALRAAKRRVSVVPRRNGTAVRVRVRNVTYAATRSGRTVLRENRTVEVTVATPVFALHDRVERFERRLNRGALDGPGLGRRLTARLYPVAWARGYAQRYGAPVENVLANRHVAVSTNGAVLETERAVFGRSDPGGKRGLRRARAHLLARDLTAPLAPVDGRWTRRVLAAPNGPPEGSDLPRFDPADVPTPEGNATVRVGTTAERSLGRLLVASGNRSFEGATRAGYRARVRLRTATEPLERESRPAPDPPGEEFDLETTSVHTDVTVTNASAPLPARGPGERRFASFERRAVVEHTVVREWEGEEENDTETTEATWQETYLVGVVLTGEPDRRAPGPNRTVRPAFRPGGPLAGPNMVGVPEAARDRLVASQGGRDGVAAAVARDSLDRSVATVTGDRPDGLGRYVYADLRDLRDRVRNVTVTPARGRVATGRANPPALLAERLRERRSELVAAPETYRGAADRARVAARATYLDRVIATLARRGAARRERVERLDGLLRARTDTSLDGVHRTMRERRNVSTPDRGAGATGPAGPVAMVPDASPAYLTLTGVGHERAAAVPAGASYRPLAARNLNLFTVPYGDAADAVVGAGRVEHGTGLRAAADVLAATDGRTAGREDGQLADRRRRLRRATARELDRVRARTADALRRRTSLDTGASRAVVRAAFERWTDVGGRARAVANGSAAEAVAAAAVARLGTGDPTARDRLAAELRAVVAEATAGVRIDDGLVERTAVAARGANGTPDRGRGADTGAPDPDDSSTSDADRPDSDATDGRDSPGRSRLLAGLPVTPSPGHWYLTVNVWTVRVRGAFARFAVRTRRGAPGASLRYARDGSWATLDVDGDGARERIGRDQRLSFETNTSVVVAVPPYGPGVGDTGGDADERSAGWPRPACLPPDVDACDATANATGVPRPARAATGRDSRNGSSDNRFAREEPSGSYAPRGSRGSGGTLAGVAP